MESLKGRTAVVTGASSGIGAAFARQLAARGADVILTARRKDRLDALGAEIERAYGVQVSSVVVDLGKPGGAKALFDATVGAGKHVDILINNAGFGTKGRFDEIAWEKTEEQIRLNVLSLTELTHRFVRSMLEHGRGHILNVASTAAYTPVPNYATYAAGKAFVRDFTEAIAAELAETNVRVCCLCPGGTRTEFFDVAGHRPSKLVQLSLMSPDVCADIGLHALFEGRRNIVGGWANSIMCWLLRFVPRRAFVWGAGKVME